MAKFKSEFVQVMFERGHINQCTNIEGLDEKASKEIITGYIGYDATADSLHVGNLAAIMMLRRLQQTGHRPVVLMGGATTKIGDPSFRDETRKMFTDEQIAKNIEGIKSIFKNYLNFEDSPTGALMVNNADWLEKIGYIEMLKKIGTHFTINRMLTFDSVKLRLDREQPLTFLEFNYMIMQGYDFWELNKRHNISLQMGGSDQWGNIVNGVELTRRIEGKELYGLTTPLIQTASGVKMGKSVSGAVWLRGDKLSPYDYWQFWRNTEDADVVRFLKLFTDLPLPEIEKLEKLQGSEINEAKKVLAFEAAKLAHGEHEAEQAAKTAQQLFENKDMNVHAGNLPVYNFKGKVSVAEVMVELGLASSKGEAKRLIEQGGVKINDQTVSSIQEEIQEDGMISVGKKRHGIIRMEN
ncbi:MAG: tyrosine--tRNA ligase [Alphaproteobacteria bacterium]|nr:tyrosine--tRNA ligase [Alphaproteobacteria bacterium]MCL2504832.1 tyrosine--tRNA ligase [Alphaproteobacteria bacterium]